MAELMRRLEELRAAFGRLTQREQLMVLGGGGVAVVLVLALIGVLVGSALSNAERRVKVKTEQLVEVIELQGGTFDGFQHVDGWIPQRLVTATGPNPLPR